MIASGKRLRLWFKLASSYIFANKRSFAVGFVLSVLAVIFYPKLSPYLFRARPESTGIVGNFTLSTLPRPIQEKISYGLVHLDEYGLATAGAATNWSSTDSGKTLEFTLKPNVYWQDGQLLKADQINYNLRGVEISKSSGSIKFTMKEPFAPLITLLSQPLFKNGLVGLGDDRLKDIKFNGRFLSSITLENTTSKTLSAYKFYPSEKILISALKLGSVKTITGLHNTLGLEKIPSYQISQTIDENSEAVIFFNNQKGLFEDKSFRQGLVYALPDSFAEGESAETPFPKNSWAISPMAKEYPFNLDTAKNLITKGASGSANLTINLTTIKDLEPVAQKVAASWTQAGVKTNVEISDMLPVNYDAYLTYLELPLDPDQYSLWHSTQTGNVAGYKSFKVDKLLEEGRKTTDFETRVSIYADFQKAITEDVPAAFLFYPKVYTIKRL